MDPFQSKIWVAMDAEKEASMGSEDESSLVWILILFDQVSLLLGQRWNTRSHIRRIDILMAFLGDKRRTETILIDNTSTCCSQKCIIWTQIWRGCSEVPKLKVKISNELFRTIKHHDAHKGGMRRQLFRMVTYFKIWEEIGTMFLSAAVCSLQSKPFHQWILTKFISW